jgi:hypothetical protein
MTHERMHLLTSTKKFDIKGGIIMRIHIFTVFFLGVCLTFAQERSVAILSTTPSLDVNDNKPGDIYVYKTEFMGGKFYEIVLFRIEKDSLRHYKAYYGNEDVFDRAFFKWENDSTVAIRLHNTKDKKDIVFKVLGYGQTTEIRTED